jgi:hypothetical protein
MAILTILRSLPIPTEIVPTERACSNNFSVGIGNRDWQSELAECTYICCLCFPKLDISKDEHAKKDPPFFVNVAFFYIPFRIRTDQRPKKSTKITVQCDYILINATANANANAKTFLCYS